MPAAALDVRGPALEVIARMGLDDAARRASTDTLGIAKGFAPETRWEVWSRNANLRMLRYLPWKDLVFSLMTRDSRQAASAITLKSHRAASDSAAAPAGSLVLLPGA